MEPKNLSSTQSEKESTSSSDFSQRSNNTFLLTTLPPRKVMPDQDPNPTKRRMLRIEFVVNLINHMLIGFVTIYMSWMCLRVGLKKTALHAWLCTLGFILLMAEGVMSHYNGNIATFLYTRKTKTTLHWVLQALGGSLGIAGGIVKMSEKEVHFVSTHGKLGFSAMIICAVSMLTGLSSLYSQSLRKILKPLFNKTFHIVLGFSAFVVGALAQFYGYQTNFFRRQVTEDFRMTIECITLTLMVLSSFGILKALWSKGQSIGRNL